MPEPMREKSKKSLLKQTYYVDNLVFVNFTMTKSKIYMSTILAIQVCFVK